MNNKADIEALRERLMKQREAALTGNEPSFEETEELTCDVMSALRSSLSQLEAERQRADELASSNDRYRQKWVDLILDNCDAGKCIKDLEAELAALRGEQEPVADNVHPSMINSVTVLSKAIGSYENASGGISDIVTLSDKREMKSLTEAELSALTKIAIAEWKSPPSQPVEKDFLPKNLDRALTVMGIALPESEEEFNFQAERWMQRLIDRVIRFGSEIQPASKPVVVLPDLWELNNPGEGSYYMSHEPTGWRKDMVIARYVKIEAAGGVAEGIE